MRRMRNDECGVRNGDYSNADCGMGGGTGGSKPSFFSFLAKAFRLHGVHLAMDSYLSRSRYFIVQINPTYHR